MECPHCGAKNAFRAKFCRRCAQRLDTLPENGGESPLPLVEPIVPLAKNSNRLVVFLLLLLAIAGWYFLRPAKPGTETVSAENNAAASRASNRATAETWPSITAPAPAPAVADNHETPTAKTEERKSSKPAEPAEKTKPKPKPKSPKAQAVASNAAAQPAADSVQSQPKLAVAPAVESTSGLAVELEGCNSRGFLAKALCIERVRWKYCPGKWGKIPDCPKPENGESGG
jgi:hypothetical protein